MSHLQCPKCNAIADANEFKYCTCFYSWNVFTTNGKCPNCRKVWAVTQCIECDQWSPIEDWYPELKDAVDDLLKK